MSKETNIEWCDSTFNPWIGCTAISPACDNCYAEALMDKRMHHVTWGSGSPRKRTSKENWKLPIKWNNKPFFECKDCGWRGYNPAESITLNCHCCNSSNISKAKRRVFCASLADVFDNEIDQLWREDLWTLIEQTQNLDWLLLTKRIGNVKAMVPSYWVSGQWPSHVWLGITIINQEEAERDIPKLLDVPAEIKFLSVEPMLGPIDLKKIEIIQSPGYFGDCLQWYHQPHFQRETKWNGINWVICGGESGQSARPMHPYWVRSLRDQCAVARIPFLFKQWGEWAPRAGLLTGGGTNFSEIDPQCKKWPDVIRLGEHGRNSQYSENCGDDAGESVFVQRVGKNTAGRLLDGKTYDEFPGKYL